MSTRLTVEIDPELRQRAKAAAAQQGRSLADVVRTALETFVEQAAPGEEAKLIESDPIFQMAGKYSGSAENISEHADEIIEADIDPVRGMSARSDSPY